MKKLIVISLLSVVCMQNLQAKREASPNAKIVSRNESCPSGYPYICILADNQKASGWKDNVNSENSVACTKTIADCASGKWCKITISNDQITDAFCQDVYTYQSKTKTWTRRCGSTTECNYNPDAEQSSRSN